MNIEKALKDWTSFNDALRDCTEAEAQSLIKAEQKGEKRKAYVLRAYTRFKRLRDSRERRDLLAKL